MKPDTRLGRGASPAWLSSPSLAGVLIGLAIVYGISISPVLIADVPPLVDYPSHLARIKIVSEWSTVQEWQDFYAIQWRVLPNLAFEMFAAVAGVLVGIGVVGRLFVAAMLFMLLSGTVALNYALFREYSLWPLLSAVFFYNWTLLYGFVNYVFGLGLALWALAAWVVLRDRPRVAVGVSGLVSVALFFSHLIALVLYAVCIVTFEAALALRDRPNVWAALRRQAVLAGSQFVIPTVLFVYFSPTARELELMTFPTLKDKGLFLIGLMRSGDQVLDWASLVVYAGACGTLLWRRSLRFSAEFAYVAAALVMLFVVAPSDMATTANVDKRLPIFLCFLFFAVTQITWRRGAESLVVAVLALWVVVRPAVLAFEWRAYDAVYQEYRSAFRGLASGSTLFTAAPLSAEVHTLHVVTFKPASSPYPRGWDPPLRHVGTLAILEQRVFVPQIFAYDGQQPLQIHPHFRPLAAFQTSDPLPIPSISDFRTNVVTMRGLHADAWRRHGAPAGHRPRAYLLWLSADQSNPAPDLLRAVKGGPDFQVFEIIETAREDRKAT